MGAIKDLVDLIVDLDKRVTDRRILDALFPLKQKAADAEHELVALERDHLALERNQFNLEKQHHEAMTDRDRDHTKAMDDLKTAHADEMEALKAAHAKEMNDLKTNVVEPLQNRVAEADERDRVMKAGLHAPMVADGGGNKELEEFRRRHGPCP